MNASVVTWVARVLWLALPLTTGALISSALDGRSGPVRFVVVLAAWGIWSAGLLAALVTHPVALTVFRVLAPLPLVGGVVAAIDVTPSAAGWVGLVVAAAVVGVSLSADLGADFIDGASYGDERRFGLRPPGALLLGPLPIVWALTTLPFLSGAVLLAARQWLIGGLLVVVGGATCWWGLLVLHRLARRCLVFVPAGVTLVDDMAVATPVLFRRSDVVRLGPAPADTEAMDLSSATPGLVLQIDVDPAVSLVPTSRRGGTTEAIEAGSVLVAPSRPGALLRHADERDLAVRRG